MARSWAHFKLADFVQPGEHYHFARTELSGGEGARVHDHDYHEVFWLTRGHGEHRWNGRNDRAEAGRFYLIRPQDRHRVAGSSSAPLHIINLAFPSEIWAEVRKRYFADQPDWFEQRDTERVWPVGPRAKLSLDYWARRLTEPDRPRVVLEGFLMELPSLRGRDPALGTPLVPEWLARAQREILKPEHFANGTAGFARLAGRSPSHVSRATERWLGCTPTDLVNAARIDHAARQLAETGRPILDIMFDCGLTNLSHFYALFRKRHGVSPRRYRLQAHPTVRG